MRELSVHEICDKIESMVQAINYEYPQDINERLHDALHWKRLQLV